MYIYIVCSILVVIPLVVHYRTYDVANGSAGSALSIALISSLLVPVRESWQVALLAFFLAAFAGFAFAYIVGLLYRSLGSQERRDFKAARANDPPASRRVAIGAAGAVLISLTVFAIQAMSWLQSGAWPSMPTKVLLGFLAFFILGVGCLLSIYIGRHRAA